MTLFDYVKSQPYGAEITVWYQDFDDSYPFFLYNFPDDAIDDEYNTPWNKAMMIIAKHVDVLTETSHGITTNIVEVIYDNLNGIWCIELNTFHVSYARAIFDGYVSDEWITSFAQTVR